MSARFSSLPAAICLALAAIAGGFAATRSEPARAPPSASAAAAAPSADAAAKHAKRTVCLKEAKAKKLLGAEKTAFLKTCMAGP
ncbi:MAG TPA: PsiF family protein [Steroidobacteraceae bacterium]|nr:PsiF family protein [Steroidobacteraceae bacterium]